MKVAFFDTHQFERAAFEPLLKKHQHEFVFLNARLDRSTVLLAQGCDAVCCFANDKLDADILKSLKDLGIRIIALRSAGYNHVDLNAAKRFELPVVRVPAYSPYAIAEHAVALLLMLNRKLHRAQTRVRELNFSLEGLVGFDLHGKTVGVVGTGKIGQAFAQIMLGFGCQVLAHDIAPDESFQGVTRERLHYVSLEEVLKNSDVISLHVPLTDQTRHLIDSEAISRMKKSVILINTGRGALIETKALIDALKRHQIGGAALDVYEEEGPVFFADHSSDGIDDDILARLLTFPNVVMTSHQGFLTEEALGNIAATTLENLTEFESGRPLKNLTGTVASVLSP